MVTEAYQNDINRLADQLREFPLELEPASPLIVGMYMIELHIESSDLRAVSALNNAFQLAFDAAGMAVFGSTEEVALDLLWGGSGSWREVFIVRPRTALGREQLNYLVGVALQALTLIPGFPPLAVVALYSIFAGSMIVASIPNPTPTPVPVDSVDASALSGVVVSARLYPPGNVWRPPAGRTDGGPLSKLSVYVSQHEDAAHFTVTARMGGHHDVALVVESQIDDRGKAEAIAQWHAKENGLPYRS